MRIGIDARPLQAETKNRGIGKSLEFFLDALAKSIGSDSVVFYVDKNQPLPEILVQFPTHTLRYVRSHPIRRRKYIRSTITPYARVRPSHDDIDVFLQYDAALGVPKSVPTAVIFHDLIPYLFHDEEQRLNAQAPLRRRIKNTLASHAYWQQYHMIIRRYHNAATIIAISESSKRDYEKYIHLGKRQDICVIPHGVHESFFQKPPSHPDDPRLALKKPFFTYVGGIDLRKNIAGLLRDFVEFRKKHDAQLVLAGKEFALQNQLDDLGWDEIFKKYPQYKNDVIRPGFVSHNDLLYLLSHSSGHLFPTRYEGFGLPALEAMAVGCPVITYDNSSIPEVVGDSFPMLATGESMVPVMEDMFLHRENYQDRIDAAKQKARGFTWKSTARQIIDSLKDLDNHIESR